jgi:organic hydroperoxide reductase OsmC/OhrA
MAEHTYDVSLAWTGNRGQGTTGIKDYDRDLVVSCAGHADIEGTADPSFLGDPKRWSPEQLLTVAVSQCHMLWYLGLAARRGVVVHEYLDEATGTMATDPSGKGVFTKVVLRPRIVVAAEEQVAAAVALHAKAHEMCFVAQSVRFPVEVEPHITVR